MDQRRLKTALHEGERVYGTLITSTSPRWLTVVPGLGLDFVFIDTEHIAIDRLTLSWMCRAYGASGHPPIVRIPNHDPYEATKTLDGGAAGIVAPYIERPDQVLDLYGAVGLRPLKGDVLQQRLRDVIRFGSVGAEHPPPDSNRSDRAAAPRPGREPSQAGETQAEYLRERNAASILIANIESVPALESLEDILAVPGLDAVLVGPHDLSVSLGVPEQYENPVYVDAVDRIIATARGAGLGAGIHMAYYDQAMKQEKRWIELGANLIIHSADILAFQWSMGPEIGELRTAFGDHGTSTDLDTHGSADQTEPSSGDEI